MVHRKVHKGVKENFYDALISRGERAEYIPLKNIIDFVESFGDTAKISKIKVNDTCDRCLLNEGKYICFRFQSFINDDFPLQYHDKDETFKVLQGSIMIEYLEDNKYNRVTLHEGDHLTIKAGAKHRGRVEKDLVAHLSFRV